MFIRSVTLIVFTLLCALQPKAQNVKYGKVSPNDFDVSKLKVDTSKGAVIISDVGESTFEGNNKSWFSLIFKRKRRILILNKNSFDLAKVDIRLYRNGNDEEKVDKLKGSTYNLVDGKVEETKLNSDAIFKDKYDKNHVIQKFSMPAVKEGSIIEYSYTINSDFLFNLQPWEFQGTYPRVWSEYNVSIPDFFEYVTLAKGYLPFDENNHPTRTSTYYVRIDNGAEASDQVKLDAIVTDHHWVMKNVPALTEENYTTTIDNYISKIDFQMAGTRFKGQVYHNVMGSWATAGEKLLEDEDFGKDLKRNNNWLDDVIKNITAKTNTDEQKAQAIFYYVKNNIKCTDAYGIMLTNSLKDIFKNKSGSVADVNLLLTAMLKHENLDANPVILSTRHNGTTNYLYPLLSEYNYLICALFINDKPYFLDASQPYLGFNRLPSYTYNGTAQIIKAQPQPIDMLTDNLSETKVTYAMLYADEKKPGNLDGTVKSELGYFESCSIRDQINTNGKEAFEKTLLKKDYKVSEISFENLDTLEKPIEIDYAIDLGNNADNDIIYLNPMLAESYTKNPFQSADRKYPVEMPYKIDETYFLNMEVPAGYEVDEMPKQIRALYNSDEGIFEYLITKDDYQISMKCHLKFEKANFSPEDYESLRNFFGLIVKKESEQIVLKKKK